jgi:phosphate-selective porin OprO/OprP
MFPQPRAVCAATFILAVWMAAPAWAQVPGAELMAAATLATPAPRASRDGQPAPAPADDEARPGLFAGAIQVAGRAAAQAAAPEKPSIYDRIWKFSEWYSDDNNPVVQKILFTGRFQHDFVVLDADQGDHDESNLRRLRLGPRVTMFHKLLLHTEIELNPQERNPTYVRFTDMYGQWTFNPKAVLQIGKQSVPFTLEGATSSRELLTIDRSNLANNIWFTDEYMPGVSVSGKRDAWIYRGGVDSSGERTRELGRFNGGIFTLGVVGYDFAKALNVKQALLTGNYVYQHPDTRNTFTQRLEHIGSTSFKLELSRGGVQTDVAVASGYLGQCDLWSALAMPFFNATPKLQFVGRYTYVHSADPNGVRLATYENRVVSGRGDEYNELYAGANYYFYGQKLKVQTGLQWADMQDKVNDGGAYSGVSWTTGLRVGW